MTTAEEQVARRRAFAIISHPDAGKTTLTEKLLLYGGAIHLAGSVTARKNQRSATSDWMELEKQRGISITSTVLQFEYSGLMLNLLDTPGHRDFSEDTYRVLTAVDSVVMVIDAAKGIEDQTKKLFEICRQRGVPIFTFMNKVDRPTKSPIDLLDELERVLGLSAYAMNWPLGTGPDFRGVYSRVDRQAHFFERTPQGAFKAPTTVADLNDPSIRERMSEDVWQRTADELELVDGASPTFDEAAIRAGKLTPVFFGSAMNNFGVQMLLDAFCRLGEPPRPRESSVGVLAPSDPAFSGFVFKIQANMDPRHRDRIAFLRVCSGQFQRDMSVTIARTGKKIRVASSHRLFGQERETIDDAWPGDIIGIVGHADLRIGDTLTQKPELSFNAFPRFAAETFAYLHLENPSQAKRFRQGLDQLLQEGVVQVLQVRSTAIRVPLLGAVGPLQFEVVQYRLKSEYGADSRLETTSWSVMRWVDPTVPAEAIEAAQLPTGARFATDEDGRLVALFESEWALRYFADRHPAIRLLTSSSMAT
jgi:peptide chain release factor 3